MAPAEGRRARALLACWLVAAFAVSAVTDARVLAACWVVALVAFRQGAARHLARVALIVAPPTLLAGAVALAWARVTGGPSPSAPALVALVLRPALVAFGSLAVLARVRLASALAPWPAASRLVTLTLAQIHALRLVATESRLGFKSRMPVKPRTRELVASAGTLTGTMLAVSLRNARDVADALRARGLS